MKAKKTLALALVAGSPLSLALAAVAAAKMVLILNAFTLSWWGLTLLALGTLFIDSSAFNMVDRSLIVL